MIAPNAETLRERTACTFDIGKRARCAGLREFDDARAELIAVGRNLRKETRELFERASHVFVCWLFPTVSGGQLPCRCAKPRSLRACLRAECIENVKSSSNRVLALCKIRCAHRNDGCEFALEDAARRGISRIDAARLDGIIRVLEAFEYFIDLTKDCGVCLRCIDKEQDFPSSVEARKQRFRRWRKAVGTGFGCVEFDAGRRLRRKRDKRNKRRACTHHEHRAFQARACAQPCTPRCALARSFEKNRGGHESYRRKREEIRHRRRIKDAERETFEASQWIACGSNRGVLDRQHTHEKSRSGNKRKPRKKRAEERDRLARGCCADGDADRARRATGEKKPEEAARGFAKIG